VAGQEEERVYTLNSAAKDKAVITVCTNDQCTDAVGQSISAIIELFQDIATQGSGCTWNRSVGLDVLVSKKYDRIPLKGPTSDCMIEKMVKKEQETKNSKKRAQTRKKTNRIPPVQEGNPPTEAATLSFRNG